MKKILFILVVFTFALKACGQVDQTFTKPVYFNAGFYMNGIFYNTIPTGTIPDWNVILNKPVFSTVAITGDYNDLKNLPQQKTLYDAIRQLGFLPIPGQPTSALPSIIPPVGSGGIVFDITEQCYKFWDPLTKNWSKVAITSN